MCPNPWEGEQLVLGVQKDEGHTECGRMAHDMSLILGQPLTGLKNTNKTLCFFPPSTSSDGSCKDELNCYRTLLIIHYKERYSQKKHKKIREENVCTSYAHSKYSEDRSENKFNNIQNRIMKSFMYFILLMTFQRKF